MRKIALLATGLGAMLVPLLPAALAQAQSETTFVSSTGVAGGPCSRAAPCNNFQSAHDATAPEGEIRCLDPGPFGGATLAKTITIDCAGTTTNQFIINGTNVVVRIRNLTFNGVLLGITAGISLDFVNGAALFVENCVIANNDGSLPSIGIKFEPGMGINGKLYVSDTVISNNGQPMSGGGIFIQPLGSGTARAVIERTRVEQNTHGIVADGSGGTGSIVVQINDTTVAGNSGNGIWAKRAGIVMDHSSSKNNAGNGILADGPGAVVHLGQSTVVGNGAGLSATGGGQILSYQNNQASGNVIDGAPTGVLTVK